MWVRGLKQIAIEETKGGKVVAPYVGAWIETSIYPSLTISSAGRTLCGCVD